MKDQVKLQKVIHAMLAMQRFAWEQGVASQAMFESGNTDLAIVLAIEAVHRQLPDGRLAIVGDSDLSTDPGANGIPVLMAYEHTHNEILKKAAQKMANWLLFLAPRTEEGVLYHFITRPLVMVDSIHHIAPFLCYAGYCKEAVDQIKGFRRLMLQPEQKLYSYLYDDSAKKFARKDFWGGGNGWMAVSLVKVINRLPENMQSEKRELKGYYIELAENLYKYQRDDGLFHDVIDQPDTFIEGTAAMMLAYSVFMALGSGWLNEGYRKRAELTRNSMWQKVDDFGILHDVCGAPHFNRSGSSVEAQAFFILMETAYAKLNQGN